MNNTILGVSHLKTYFFTRRGVVKAVDGIDFELKRGECLCLVGESGCGKTVTALSILGLIDSPPGRIIDGEVRYNNLDLVKCSPTQLRRIRGKEIAIIFQDAQSALNPVFTIGDQIVEQIRLHLGMKYTEARDKAMTLLKEMGIPSVERAMSYYPHQLSGGMKQRAMIAMSLSCDPQVLIADEPTTAVDVTIKAQILDIFHELKAKRQMSLIFITHDLGVVAEIGDRAVVIYGGKVVEMAPVSKIIGNPKHPYTAGLIDCLPDISKTTDRLASIPGTTPNPIELPQGCPFHPRCHKAMEICSQQQPPEVRISEGHEVSCHLYQ
ncbi:MAG TPA: ABC transporter ATP-binding protein [Dehalococcoidia bacterium]|nr:ABC transporter ATP-binding protein [Dehalococcoidia bacterium]